MKEHNFKRKEELSLYNYGILEKDKQEIDIIELILTLWNNKLKIILCTFVIIAVCFFISLSIPKKWTSIAIVTPIEEIQWSEFEKKLTKLRIYGVDVKLNKDIVFNQFIKKFHSNVIFEEYITSSSYIMNLLNSGEINRENLNVFISNLRENMKITSNDKKSKNEIMPFNSWTLSYTAKNNFDAQTILLGFVDYISEKVKNETNRYIKNVIEIKTNFEREKLSDDLIKIKNNQEANIQRLKYSLEIANAAGIKKPAYSYGHVIKDDPDYSISLGSDGIKRKLIIEKKLEDLSEINGDIRSRKYIIQQLNDIDADNILLSSSFHYQLSPTLPIDNDGPRKSIIIAFSGLLGFIFSCGWVLLLNAIKNNKSQ